MKSSAQKINTTTQKFTQVEDVVNNIVILTGGRACLVLEIVATNFSLQSEDEQQSRIFSYASLLNSLSFPIQIVIVSRKLDIGSYIKLLEEEASTTKNPALASQIKLYKDFVSELVKVNTVLDKKFYITISYSYLEKGATGIADIKNKNEFAEEARKELYSKAGSITQELLRVGLKSKILQKEELVQLFYEAYNSGDGGKEVAESIGKIFTKGA